MHMNPRPIQRLGGFRFAALMLGALGVPLSAGSGEAQAGGAAAGPEPDVAFAPTAGVSVWTPEPGCTT
jgi:hypothetical protein